MAADKTSANHFLLFLPPLSPTSPISVQTLAFQSVQKQARPDSIAKGFRQRGYQLQPSRLMKKIPSNPTQKLRHFLPKEIKTPRELK